MGLQCGAVSAHLPLPPQDVLLHPLLGELLGLHVLGVLFKPGVLKALLTGQTSPVANTGTEFHTLRIHCSLFNN